MKNHILMGLTGGIASGKSITSQEFQRLGSHVIDADIIAREVVAPGMPALDEIKEYFGDKIITDSGQLNRKLLGSIVFNDREKRKLLEKITHPKIITQQNTIIQKLITEDFKGVIVVNAALLIESGYFKKMDKIVVVYTDRKTQLKRLLKRDNTAKSEAEKKINAQMALDEKLKYADHVIDNSSTIENMKKQVEILYDKLRQT